LTVNTSTTSTKMGSVQFCDPECFHHIYQNGPVNFVAPVNLGGGRCCTRHNLYFTFFFFVLWDDSQPASPDGMQVSDSYG
jgi:hypothetical protein